MTEKPLTQKDIEKLKMVLKSIEGGNACSYDKKECITALNSVINPHCVVCRGELGDDIVVVEGKKAHSACSKRIKTN